MHGALIIAFDLDGTLVDSVADLASSLNAALAELDIAPCSVDVVRSFVGNGARMLVERALVERGQPTLRTDELLERFRKHYERDLLGNTRPFPGVVDVVTRLKEHALLAVATNKPGVMARPIVDALMPGVFSCVVGPDDVGALKPDGAMIKHIEKALGSRVIAFVGDSGVDMDTAKNAGVVGVGVLWGLKPDEVKAAQHAVVDAAELESVLEKLIRESGEAEEKKEQEEKTSSERPDRERAKHRDPG